jgi:hypothetical protein
VLEQRLAGLRQADLARVALEKLNPKLPLQHLDALGKGRLRDIDGGCRATKMELVRDS